MKKVVFSSLIAGGLSVALLSCAKPEKKEVVNPTEKKRIVEIGEEVSMKLLKTLKGELVKALKKSPKDAISVCSQKAIPLTKKIEEEVDHGIEIKRTSFKFRNPANAPDKYEKEALRYFENTFAQIKQLENKIKELRSSTDIDKLKEADKLEQQLKQLKEKAKYYIQKVKENGKTYYRYYKPLKIQPVCLTCHGDKLTMDKSVREEIKRIYPNDLATGYKVGDFRGVIRVSIPEGEIK